MNSKEITYQLKNPATINKHTTEALDEVIQEFPYFQAARALQLKGLYNANSVKYNLALKKTAAYTIDRSVLFDFITSLNFDKHQEIEQLEDIEIVDFETIQVKTTSINEENESKKPANSIENTQSETNTAKEILEIGKPLNFSTTEPHSFNEWMQLASKKPINRDNKALEEDKSSIKPSNFDKKINLIDKFIETNPKIKPANKHTEYQNNTLIENQENESLMTETLAKIYLEQKKYDNAIKAYRILSLKYPEKSGFFADRIKAIKILQKK